MDVIRNQEEEAFLNEAAEAHQNGAMIFVARVVAPWHNPQGLSTAVPAVAVQIEGIERVGWRLEFISESRQFRLGADQQGAYCVFRRHQW